jgi:hypothetical protein
MDMMIAQSKRSLLKTLSRSNIDVSPRGEGRTKDQVEKWVMYRCLASIAKTDLLRFPVKLTKRERPDWLLELEDERIGCEITEAVSSEKLKAESLPEADAEETVVDVSLFKHGQNQRSLDELREIASRKKLSGSGWAGDSVEKEYAEIVQDVAQKKTATLNKKGFEKFDQNWLLIYCNYNLPILDQIKAASFCRDTLESYWGPKSFDRIFVEKSDKIVSYSKLKHEVIDLNDVWQKS